MIIEGKSQKPVYLWNWDGEVIIKNAREFWDKETKKTQTIIKAELADEHIQKVEELCID